MSPFLDACDFVEAFVLSSPNELLGLLETKRQGRYVVWPPTPHGIRTHLSKTLDKLSDSMFKYLCTREFLVDFIESPWYVECHNILLEGVGPVHKTHEKQWESFFQDLFSDCPRAQQLREVVKSFKFNQEEKLVGHSQVQVVFFGFEIIWAKLTQQYDRTNNNQITRLS